MLWNSPYLNQECFILKLGKKRTIEKGSEGLIAFGGYSVDDMLHSDVTTLFPTFSENSKIQAMLAPDGRMRYFSCVPVAWSVSTFVLQPANPLSQELLLLRTFGENRALQMMKHPAIQAFLNDMELTSIKLNQIFSVYYDLLVNETNDHNSFSWNTPKEFQTQCPVIGFIKLLAAVQSYRVYLGLEKTLLSLNLIPYSSMGAQGFKLILDQESLDLPSSHFVEIAGYYLWLQSLMAGLHPVQFHFGKNNRDEFSFTFLESTETTPYPNMLIGQGNTWYSDQSLWLLGQFGLKGVRFFDSLEPFLQNALCADPQHCLMVMDLSSFSNEELKLHLAPIKEHRALKIIGSAQHISRVPSFWRGPAFIQTGQLAMDLDRLFSFFSKCERSLKIQVGRL